MPPAASLPEFCADCGAPTRTERIEDATRAVCTACESVRWQNPKPASAVAVRGDDGVLLVQRGIEPDRGQWSLPAGFLELDESHRECAVRELGEETGVTAPTDALWVHDTLKITQKESEHVVVAAFVVSRDAVEGRARPGSDAADVAVWDADRVEAEIEAVRAPYRPVIESLLG